MMTLINRVRREWSRLWRDESGPTATEYAVMLAMIVLVAAAAIQGIGSRVINLYSSINTAIPT